MTRAARIAWTFLLLAAGALAGEVLGGSWLFGVAVMGLLAWATWQERT